MCTAEILLSTHSGCVLAVGLSIETVRIPLLAVDVRHLLDKWKRCLVLHKQTQTPKTDNNGALSLLNDSHPQCEFLFLTYEHTTQVVRSILTAVF